MTCFPLIGLKGPSQRPHIFRSEVDLLRDGGGRATGEAVIIFAALRDAHTAVQRYHGGDLNGRRLEAVYEGEVNASRR